MLNRDMRLYNYFTYSETQDAYGQKVVNQEPQGKVKIAINITNQSIQDNINYKNASYVGLTQATLNDHCVIEYGDVKLKVLYVNPKGRMKQVFLAEI